MELNIIPFGKYYTKDIEWLSTKEILLESKKKNNDIVLFLYEIKKEIKNEKYPTMEQKGLLNEFYLKDTGKDYKYILFDKENLLYYNISWIFSNSKKITSSLNASDNDIILKTWDGEKKKFDDKSKNEYLFKEKAQREIEISKIKKEVENNEKILIQSIGGEVYENGEWKFVLNNMNDVENLKKKQIKIYL